MEKRRKSMNTNSLYSSISSTNDDTTASKNNMIQTIDKVHTELINHFHKVENTTIPSLEEEMVKLKEQLEQLDETRIEEILDLKDKIKKCRKELKELRAKKKRYLLENSKYIFSYFEDKKDISNGKEYKNVNILNDFFKIKSNNEQLLTTISNDKYNNSRLLYQKYWKNVNNEISNIQDYTISTEICVLCGVGELIPQEDEGVLICNNNKCGQFITHIIDHSHPSNKEPPNEVSYTSYIRLNHFKEILSQFQAKETTQIPDEVIQNIRNRIKKERISVSEINYDKMRDILRNLGYNKYFEHIQYINSLFGVKPPIMSEELHETLCVLFIEIQGPWGIHSPPSRCNFFNYNFCLAQLCKLLDQTQYLPYISMMKDRDKQLEQDMIWKRVCEDLDWQFFPSV